MSRYGESQVRGWISPEYITPGTKITGYLLKILNDENLKKLPPKGFIQLFSVEAFRLAGGVSLPDDIYGHLMAILIYRKALDESWFAAEDVQIWRAYRIERMTRIWNGEAEEMPLTQKIAHYESLLSGICTALAVPAIPPEFAM